MHRNTCMYAHIYIDTYMLMYIHAHRNWINYGYNCIYIMNISICVCMCVYIFLILEI